MELKPRVTLLIKIGTSQKFHSKVITSEILALKQSLAGCLNIFGVLRGIITQGRAFLLQYLTVNGTGFFTQETHHCYFGEEEILIFLQK